MDLIAFIKEIMMKHFARLKSKTIEEKILTWLHITISNIKTQLLNSYNNIKPEFLQAYLDEFYYKFNRRYFVEAV